MRDDRQTAWSQRDRARALLRGLALIALVPVQAVLFVAHLIAMALSICGLVFLFHPVVEHSRWLPNLARRLADEWSGVTVPAPYRPRPAPLTPGPDGMYRSADGRRLYVTPTWPTFEQRGHWLGRDPATWRDIGWLLVDPLVGGVLAVLPVVLVGGGLAVLADQVALSALPNRPVAAVAGLAAIAGGWLLGPAALRWHGRWTKVLLGPLPAAALARRQARGQWYVDRLRAALRCLWLGVLSLLALPVLVGCLLAIALAGPRISARVLVRARWLPNLFRQLGTEWFGLVLPAPYLPTPTTTAPPHAESATADRNAKARTTTAASRSSEPGTNAAGSGRAEGPTAAEAGGKIRADASSETSRGDDGAPWRVVFRGLRKPTLRDPAAGRDLLFLAGQSVFGTGPLLLPMAMVGYGLWCLFAPGLAVLIGRLIKHPRLEVFTVFTVPPPTWYGTLFGSPALAVVVGAGLFAAGMVLGPRLLRWEVRWLPVLLRPTASAELLVEREVLARRVQQLTETRTVATDTQAAEVRRIERDLHDGAQARLVAMGMALGTIEALIDHDPAAAKELLAEVRESSATALAELRDLVRGIHPPVLAERGLVDAIRALALDIPLPVEVRAELTGRPEPPVESAVYFAVAEALTNATKHSGADRVWLDLRLHEGALRITVLDNGHGGADPDRGSGLRGMERRLGTFDGRVVVSSPPGGPTLVTLELPCVLSSPRTSISSEMA